MLHRLIKILLHLLINMDLNVVSDVSSSHGSLLLQAKCLKEHNPAALSVHHHIFYYSGVHLLSVMTQQHSHLLCMTQSVSV